MMAKILWPLLLVTSNAFAHCDGVPKHGGRMNDGGSFCFEMVAGRGEVLFFVEDHGQPVPTIGARGAMVLERMGGAQATVPLTSRGANALVAKTVLPAHPERVSVRVEWADGGVTNGRFHAQARRYPP